jgi:phosphotransferase system  glucose/maltose/N-acetylglucosamine-specific IIC component
MTDSFLYNITVCYAYVRTPGKTSGRTLWLHGFFDENLKLNIMESLESTIIFIGATCSIVVYLVAMVLINTINYKKDKKELNQKLDLILNEVKKRTT